jgi:DNA-binding transcriptional LysR family regulator
MLRERRSTSSFPVLSTVVLPRLCPRHGNGRNQVQFEFRPWQSGIAELVEHGQVDLVLHVEDGLLPSHFQSERFCREDWICALARSSRFASRLSLKQFWRRVTSLYLRMPVCRRSPTNSCPAVDAKRSSCIRVSYFGVAWQCLPGTELVLTLTSGVTSVVNGDPRLDLVQAPHELHRFHFLMAWRPRLNSDPCHLWLREVV